MLSEEDKKSLQSLKNHPWYQVLVRLNEEATNQFWHYVATNFDPTNPEHLKAFETCKIYAQARKEFLTMTEKHIQEIHIPKV